MGSRDIDERLLLRWATPEDLDKTSKAVVDVFSSPSLRLESLGIQFQRLSAGENGLMTNKDCLVIVDKKDPTQPIVAFTSYWQEQHIYEGISYNVGRPAWVGVKDNPDFRGKRLQQHILDELHRRSKEDGTLVQVVNGINYYYRQFGYEYAIEYGQRSKTWLQSIPTLKDGQVETLRYRRATMDDVDDILAFDIARNQNCAVFLPMSRAWITAQLKEFEKKREDATYFLTRQVIMFENFDGKTVGFFIIWGLEDEACGDIMSVYHMGFAPDLDIASVIFSAMRNVIAFIKTQVDETRFAQFTSIGWHMSESHPVARAIPSHMRIPATMPYDEDFAYYVRVPELDAFIRHILPALNRRLKESSLHSSYTGSIRVSNYSPKVPGFELDIKNGEICQVSRFVKRDQRYDPNLARFPSHTFLLVLFGRRSIDDLKYIFPDVDMSEDVQKILDVLFPKKISIIHHYMYPCLDWSTARDESALKFGEDAPDSLCEKISVLYEEIGTSEKDRKEQTQSLFESFIQLMDQQTKTITEERESLKRKCTDTLDNIARYKRLMGTYVDNEVISTPKHPLLTWLSELCDTEEIYQRLCHSELHKRVDAFRYTLGDFVECERLAEEDIDVSQPAISHIEDGLNKYQAEYDSRCKEVMEINRQIQEHWNTLGITAKDDIEVALRDLWSAKDDDEEQDTLLMRLVSPSHFEQITQKLEMLMEFRSQREFCVDELLHKIMKIWDLLCLESELQRLNVIKEERMEEFIRRAREELKSLWDQLYYSDEQRQKFKPAYTESTADETLEAHEKEITRTHILIEDQKHILERVEKHMRLVEEVKQFEASMSDPNRLFGKGQRDPGRLLREEKFRRRIAREMPKVKRELRSALKEYQETNGKPFCVFGKPYTDLMDEQEEQEQAKTAKTNRTLKRSSSEMAAASTPRRGNDKRIAKTPSTTPRTKPKALVLTPHRHSALAAAGEGTTPSNRRKRIKNHFEEAGLNDAEDSILHKVREHNLTSNRKTALQPLSDNQLPTKSTKEFDTIKGVDRAGSPTPTTKIMWSDEDIDEGIFDDGPDLSDLEN
ncbi:hypothetical protein INT43_000983 [Umbelopsis isabellina]|uniref:Uncharacterized protein n=1 Tax=Mortierella isabellina TaxID=91625 RepID=A0A8H7Q4B9_MORIS|nr:hypothetical protein INT43_000983 [Umbelopsis isabellina]